MDLDAAGCFGNCSVCQECLVWSLTGRDPGVKQYERAVQHRRRSTSCDHLRPDPEGTLVCFRSAMDYSESEENVKPSLYMRIKSAIL